MSERLVGDQVTDQFTFRVYKDLIQKPLEEIPQKQQKGNKTAREKRQQFKRQEAFSLSDNGSLNIKKKRKLQKKQLSIIRDLSGEENSSNFTPNGKRERSKTFDL